MIKKSAQKHNAFAASTDKAVFLVGFFGVIIYIPQLLKIWMERNVSGVSLITWSGFFLGSIVWIFYGIAHKQKPIIYINIIMAILQVVIVVGIYRFS